MSEFTVPVVRIEQVRKHDNADSLSITEVDGCPVIFKTTDFKEGDLAVYVPVESVVPVDGPFAFLATKEGQKTSRIKAKKLRGVFSMGLLMPLSALGEVAEVRDISVGHDAAALLGIVKYVEPEKNLPLGAGQRDKHPPDSSTAPVYDIESHRKYKRLFVPGEEVVITEKIHGCNARFVWRQAEGEDSPRLFVGSRSYFNKESEDNIWWKVARKHDLAAKLALYPDHVLYGEVYGQVQDLKYGATPENPLMFRAFDVYSKKTGRFLDWSGYVAFTDAIDVPRVPVLYRGPYTDEAVVSCSQGNSTIAGHIREGCVVKPIKERWDERLGRVITKLVGEQYHLRRDGTEYQ